MAVRSAEGGADSAAVAPRSGGESDALEPGVAEGSVGGVEGAQSEDAALPAEARSAHGVCGEASTA